MSAAAIPTRAFDAFLFDMDGTVLSSIGVVERVWSAWARRHGIDPEAFMPTIHGVRAVEVIGRLGLPGIDVEHEAAGLLVAELADVDGIEAIAGAAAFLRSLPTDRWAIVTSATRELALRRLAAAGLPVPPVFVTAEDVARGKPAPDCFLLAAERLGRRIEDCLVFEDAPAGVEAAEAAGASVVVVTATHAHGLRSDLASIAGYEGLLGRAAANGDLTLAVVATAES